MSTDQQIIDTSVDEELRTSFLSYAMSVIVSRALPDVRDGLKPVHRRILYSMSEMNLRPDKAYMKCARVVGDAMGKYHPHGDSAIYEALVRMAQDWSMRLPLVDGHGNFGTQTDQPAAMRYCLAGQTRIRLADGRSVRLEDLAREHGLTGAGEVAVELAVLGRDGAPVSADRIFHSGVHPTKRVTLAGGHSIRGSHNHPLLCLVNVAGVPVLQWLRLDEIQPGTVVALPRRTPVFDTGTDAEHQMGLLFGAWVAEGFASEARAGFNNTDRDYYDQVLHAYDALVGGTRYCYTRRNTTPGAELHELDVQHMAAFRDSCLAPLIGSEAADKFVPEAVWSGGPAVKRAFLQATFEGDGGMVLGPRNSMQICYTTYSRRLADELQELLLEFGVYATRWDSKDDRGYRLLINSHAGVRAFATNVGFLCTKQGQLETYLAALPEVTRRLSGDYVPFVADYVRSALRGRDGVGNNWVAKNNFDRADRWAANRETILANIKDDAVRAVITPIMDAGYRYAEVATVTDEAPTDVYSVRVLTDDHAFLAGGFINHNTESRMAKSALPMTTELDEDTVDFAPNYDGSLTEPKVMPSAFPNLVVNGSEGIAVGMATKMAPHNLAEVVAACKHVLHHPDATVEDLLAFVPGPDLPTGGIILNLEGAKEAYRTGKGMFVMRAKTHIEDITARKKGIVVTELPYQVGPEGVIAAIKKQRDLKKLAGVANVVDLTDRKSGLRLVIECKTGFQPQAVLDELLRTTPLQTNFNIHNLALVNGQPRTLSLLELVTHYVNHRVDVTTRRCQFRRRKAEARAHLLEGYLIALGGIDEVVKVIKGSKDTATARDALIKKFKLSEIQANAILEMPLRRLTSLEVEKIRTELAELQAQIAELTRLLNDDLAMRDLVGTELDQVAAEFGTPRRSQLSDAAPVVAPVNEAAARIPLEDCTVTVSATGLISHWTAPFSGARSKHDAVIAHLATDTHATIGALTSTGRVVFVPVMEVPAGGKDRGGPVVEFVDLAKGERLVALLTLGDKAPNVAVATRNGVIKVVSGSDLPKKSGQEIIGLKDGDEVIGAGPVPHADADLVLVASDAQLLRTPVSAVRAQGRTGGGVAGIKLADGAQVIAFALVAPGQDDTPVVTVAGGGAATSAKTTPVGQFPAKGRATGGVRAHRLARGEDRLVAAGIGINLTGVAANGTLVPLPAEVGKRDGAGVRTTNPLVSVAVRR